MTPFARLVWAYLPCHADQAGRLKDSAFMLKVAILPADNVDMEALLDELADRRHIIRYQANGQRYIQIRNFRKYQNPHKNEPVSTVPEVIEKLPESLQKKPEHSGAAPEKDRSAPAVRSGSGPGPDQVRSSPAISIPRNEPPEPDVPQNGRELVRVYGRLWERRWNMLFAEKPFDQANADKLIDGAPEELRREFKPALAAFLANAEPKYIEAKHPFQVFARDFDRFRVAAAPPPATHDPSRLLPRLPRPEPNARAKGRAMAEAAAAAAAQQPATGET